MKQPSEMDRLANAVAAVAATISEIITENLRRSATVLEHKIGTKTLEAVLTTQQMAEHLQVTKRTLANWMSKGYVPYFKIGGVVRFRMSDVQRVCDGNSRNAER